MRTLLKTPYLHGNILVIALVVIFAGLDEVRGKFNINLGQCPLWFKRLYLGMVFFQFGGIDNPDWRATRREPFMRWVQHRLQYRAESLYWRTRITWETYKRTGHFRYLGVAGGVTRSAPMSGLFYRTQPGGFPVISDSFFTTGNIFFVDAGTDTGGTTAGFGQHPDRAVTDIDSANNLCTASQGDTILALTGHVENITGAAGIAFDVAGVSLIGLGVGAARPTITFTATGSTWTIAGASALLQNIIVTCTAATVSMFSSSAAWLKMDAVDYVEGSAIPLQFLITTAASDDLELCNLYHNAKTTGASAQLWIRLIGCDGPRIHDCYFSMVLENGATDAVISGDGSVRSFFFQRNIIYQSGGSGQVSGILMTDGATGFSTDNRIAVTAAGTVAAIHDVGNAGFAAETYAIDDEDASAIISPAVDT